MRITSLTVGPAKFSRGGQIAVAFYGNGEPALIIIAADGEREAVATVCLDAPIIGPEKVWLKGWSENESIPEALEKAGLIKLTGEEYICSHWATHTVVALEADVMPELAKEIAAAMSVNA